MIIYVPEIAHRFGMTPSEYWVDCARKARERAITSSRAAAELAEAAFCEWRAACGTAAEKKARITMHKADAAAHAFQSAE